jgi:hypothetical protein
MPTSSTSALAPETSAESLRTEIIESQKAQADFLKWKLISVGALGSVTLTSSGNARLLACLVPLLCAYVDLISIHLMIRIVTIGAYLRERGDPYEGYTFAFRERSGQNPYIFEVTALHGSSLAFDMIIFVIGFISLAFPTLLIMPVAAAFICCGLVGSLWTAFIFVLYNYRQREVVRLAKNIFSSLNARQ